MEAYRVVIEVLKFATPRDVLKGANTVHSKWAEACESKELWYEFVGRRAEETDVHPKLTYKRLWESSVFVVLESKLLRFCLGAREWHETPLAKKIDIDWTSSTVKIDSDSILVFGISSRKDNTYKINVHTGKMKALATLTPHRQGMGVILIEDSVYAFCGNMNSKETELSSSFNIPRLCWKPLPNALTKRSFFNPCKHSNLVYLMGGTEELSPGETYSPVNNSFTAISTKWSNRCVSIFVHSCLYIIGEQKALVKEGHQKGRKQAIRDSLWGHFWSGYTPLIYEGKLVVLQRARGRLVQLDLGTMEWVSFGYEGGKQPRRKMAVRAGVQNQGQPPAQPPQQLPQQPHTDVE